VCQIAAANRSLEPGIRHAVRESAKSVREVNAGSAMRDTVGTCPQNSLAPVAWQFDCSLSYVGQISNISRKLLLASALLSPILAAGCAVHARYYDAPHADYHVWGPAEREPYARWETEQRRNHVDYKHLKDADRQAYWNWRHDHQ